MLLFEEQCDSVLTHQHAFDLFSVEACHFSKVLLSKILFICTFLFWRILIVQFLA